MRTHQGVLVTATVDAGVTRPCSRCLTVVTELSSIPIEEEFFPTIDVNTGQRVALPENAEGSLRVDTSHELDLSEALRQSVIAGEPMKPLCFTACLGLCPVCGINRNYEQCYCPGHVDPKWAVLAEKLGRPTAKGPAKVRSKSYRKETN